MLTLRKKRHELVLENEGTAPQTGAMNATYSGWRGSIMVALNQLLCWDQYFCIGGALRHVEFDPTPGHVQLRELSGVGIDGTDSGDGDLALPAYNVLSKMIYSDPAMRQDVMCIGGTSQWPATIFRGIDQWGDRLRLPAGRPDRRRHRRLRDRDGISTGGQSRTPICKLPNVEHTEQTFPLLFLYRKEVVGLRRRRQVTAAGSRPRACFIPHNTEAITQDTLSSGNAIPTSTGMMGGYPGTTNRYRFITGNDIAERLNAPAKWSRTRSMSWARR